MEGKDAESVSRMEVREMPRIERTRELAWAASMDAATSQARKSGRKRWNRSDRDLAVETFERLWPPEVEARRIVARDLAS